jgi:mRNA interferase HicA
MKRRELVRHLENNGCQLLPKAEDHSIYFNPVTEISEAVPRHVEIKKFLARKICRRLAVPEPKGA